MWNQYYYHFFEHLSKKVYEKEQYSSQNYLTYRVLESYSETWTVISMIKDEMDIGIFSHETEKTHLIGGREKNFKKIRTIIIQFLHYNDRNKALVGKNRLKGK